MVIIRGGEGNGEMGNVGQRVQRSIYTLWCLQLIVMCISRADGVTQVVQRLQDPEFKSQDCQKMCISELLDE
jgi:hypothetical protein